MRRINPCNLYNTFLQPTDSSVVSDESSVATDESEITDLKAKDLIMAVRELLSHV